MALSLKQLEAISTVLWDCAASYMDQTPYRDAANAVDAEIDLLENGPVDDALDMDLLERLDTDGGHRTGALRRAGYLEWTITDKGRKALEEHRARKDDNATNG